MQNWQLSDQHFFPFKSESVASNMLLRYSTGGQLSGILLFLDLIKRRLHRFFEHLLILRIMDLKLQNDRIIYIRILWLQHHIVSSKTAFPVGRDHISALQIHDQPQHKPMIEPLLTAGLRYQNS